MAVFVLAVGLLLVVLVGPIAFVLVLLLRRALQDARDRERNLERRVEVLEKAAGLHPPPPVETPAPAPAPAPPVPAPAGDVLPGVEPSVPRRDLEALVGSQWLTWLGILAIFFGTAFFLGTDLTGPLAGTGQIVVGVVVGALFLLAGRGFARRAGRFLALGLLGGGVALFYVSAFAAYGFHHLVPAEVVFPFLFGAAFVGGALALLESSLTVAGLALIGALLTPLLLPGGESSLRVLFPYLLAVNAGALWVATRRRWPFLPLTAFLGTVLLVGQWWDMHYRPEVRLAALAGTGLLWLLYLLLPMLGSARPGFWGTARTLVSVANGLLFEWVLYALLDPGYTALRGIVTALLALVYVVLSAGLRRREGRTPPVRAFQYTGIALAVLAVPIQFDLAWVTLGWSLMAVILVWIGAGAGDRGDRLLAYAVTAIVVWRVLLFDTVDSLEYTTAYRPLVSGRLLVGIAAAASLGVSALLLHRQRERLNPAERPLVTVFLLGGAALLLWRLSVEAIAFHGARAALTGVSTERASLLTLSFLWAVYAGILIGLGFLFRYRPVRFLGMAILGILIFKVFLLDREVLERGYRIASFVGVGFLLLLISILYQKERKT